MGKILEEYNSDRPWKLHLERFDNHILATIRGPKGGWQASIQLEPDALLTAVKELQA